MSRPRLSVPNQCPALGPCRRSIGAKARGSPAMSGAAIAIAAMTRRSPPPTTMVGLRRMKTRKPPGLRGGATSPACATSAMSVANPRIEQRVREINDEVDQHVDGREQNYDAL